MLCSRHVPFLSLILTALDAQVGFVVVILLCRVPFRFCCFVAVETHLQQWLVPGVHGCSLGDERSFPSVYLACLTAAGTFYSLVLPTISRMSGARGCVFSSFS